MPKVEIPLVAMSERTTCGEFATVLEITIETFEERGQTLPPLLIYEPRPETRIPGCNPKVPGPSAEPEGVIVMAAEKDMELVVVEALARIEAREPQPPPNNRKPVKVKENTPVKSVFRQMTEMQITVSTLTLPPDDPDGGTIFFIRTASSVEAFRRELERPMDDRSTG